ncbi:DMT family transporter [Enterovibrio calviensis]|uniref:DMT family transporter n=1 Tax=Enterovibrio calviensis TaxID=91359 RepID=UPI001FDF55F1|nr:DMT family transporter [Enterovibrio calviensis]
MYALAPIYKGTLAMMAGVGILSVDSLLIRLIESSGWTLLFWRGIISALVVLAFTMATKPEQTLKALRKPSKSLLIGSVAFSLSTVCFVLSIEHTQVASTLIIINVSPLICAALAFVFLKETIELRTLIAIVAATLGIVFVFYGKALPNASFGNMLALVTALMLAIYFVVLRESKSENAPLFLVFGGLCTAMIAILAGAEPLSLTSQEWVYVIILCAVVVPSAFILISIGPKFLPAAHANLFMLLEAILGPLFVWMVLGEVPSDKVLIGGSIVMLTLVLFTLSSAKSRHSLNKKPS